MLSPAPVLSDLDAHRLLVLGIATWEARGEAGATDGDGRSWVFASEGSGLLVEGSAGEGEAIAYASATVDGVTLSDVALLGVLASVAARLAPAAPSECDAFAGQAGGQR